LTIGPRIGNLVENPAVAGKMLNLLSKFGPVGHHPERRGRLRVAVICGAGALFWSLTAQAQGTDLQPGPNPAGLPAALAPSLPPSASPPQSSPPADAGPGMPTFLDRLMLVESGGRDDARNPRSTALGPFQFIESTFLEVARRHFAAEVAGLSPQQILALRTNRAFARRAAETYTRDNAAQLVQGGAAATYRNLRLAFLLGPVGAMRVLQAPPQVRVATLLGAPVIKANPFMLRMSAADLIAKSERDLSGSSVLRGAVVPVAVAAAGSTDAPAVPLPPRRPAIQVKCNLDLPSCRRWLSLAQVRLAAAPARTARRKAGGAS
jgi:hypothetical protein